MNDLIDTIDLMSSSDYKERFKAEFYQLSIRINKLKALIERIKNNEFTPTCSLGLLADQLYCMEGYLGVLKDRALVEHIDVEL